MQISPIKNLNIIKTNMSQRPKCQNFAAYCGANTNLFSKKTNLLNFAGGILPVSSPKEPDDIKSPESFALYFDKKIRSDLKVKSPKDIENIANSVVKRTNCTLEEAYKAISVVSSFGEYSQLKNLSAKLCDLGFNSVYSLSDGIELSHAMNYLAKKGRLELDCMCVDQALFIDDFVLEKLKKDKNQVNALKYYVKNCQLSPVLIDGWNFKDVNGKNSAYTFLGRQASLEDAACNLVEKIRKTGSLDNALNGDTVAEFKEIMGEDFPLYIVKNRVVDFGKNDPSKVIAKNLEPFMPTISYLKDFAQGVVSKMECLKDVDENEILPALSCYFDLMLTPNSAATLNDKLKLQHENIVNYAEKHFNTERQIHYTIPKKGKSFDLINYHYARINDVPQEQFINWNGGSEPKFDKNDTVVVLDDFAGSGLSLLNQVFVYTTANLKINTKYIGLAPLFVAREALNNFNSASLAYNKVDNDAILYTDYKDIASVKLTKYWDLISKMITDKGYRDISSCIALPYMLPDCNSDLAHSLCEKFIL